MTVADDLLLYNAKIYSLDERIPTGTALLIRGDRILALGQDMHSLQNLSSSSRNVDLGGGVVIPGLTDAHIHLEKYALSMQLVDCETETRAECLQRVVARAATLQPGEWVLGHGWNQNNWEEGFGRAAELDAVAPENPVYLTAKSLHAGWANSLALRRAKIGLSTTDPVDGRIGRLPDGRPDGLLFEGAIELVAGVIPEPTPKMVADVILAAQPKLLRMGLTGVHDFDRRRCFIALQQIHHQQDLHLRIVKNIPLEDLDHAVGLGLHFGFGDLHLRIGGVKLFADGALGPHTAAMFQFYEGEPSNHGMLLMDAEEILEYGRQASACGLPLTIHAIGDRANHEVLDAFTQLRAFESVYLGFDSGELRHRIEHVQVLHPKDTARLAELNLVASMQPIHATSDMEMVDRYWGERGALAYAFRTQLDHGAVLAFGSDAPVESPNPFWGLHAAVSRRRLDGTPGRSGWYPEQRIQVLEALKAYTIGPAYAAGLESQLGKLLPGYLADLIILDQDPFTCPVEELRELRPRATMVGGRWLFQESDLPLS